MAFNIQESCTWNNNTICTGTIDDLPDGATGIDPAQNVQLTFYVTDRATATQPPPCTSGSVRYAVKHFIDSGPSYDYPRTGSGNSFTYDFNSGSSSSGQRNRYLAYFYCHTSVVTDRAGIDAIVGLKATPGQAWTTPEFNQTTRVTIINPNCSQVTSCSQYPVQNDCTGNRCNLTPPCRWTGSACVAQDTPGGSGGECRGGLVPCGRLCNDPDTPRDETAACQICDIFELIDRIWKFLLTVLVPGIAIVLYLLAGLLILLGGAHPGWVATGKSIFKTTTWGVIIILAAWMLTNTVMRSLAGDSIDRSQPWYVIECVNPAGAPPPSTQRYACGSQGCVARSDGQFDNFEACRASCPATQTQAGTCTGVSCAPDSLSCTSVNPGDGCDAAAVNALGADITRGAGGINICSGVDTVKLLKAIVANESDGRVSLVSDDGLSAGPFQLTIETAEAYKSACGVTAPINFDWLKRRDTVEKQACIAATFIKQALVGACGCDVRQLAAGYNGGGKGKGACGVSSDCGPAAASAGNECSMCSNQGSRPTKRWECLWNNPEHTVCNKDRIVDGKPASFAPTRRYAPRVEYCYGQFGGTTSALTCPVTIKPWSGADPYIESFSGSNDPAAWRNTKPELRPAFEAVRARYPNVTLISTWRPQEYQDHIRSVWDAVRFVDGRSVTVPTSYGSCPDAGTTYPAPQGWQNCTSFKSTVTTEASRHDSNGPTRPACTSEHIQGFAIDFTVPGVSLREVVLFAESLPGDIKLCHNIASDAPHFILKKYAPAGTACSQGI